MARYEHLPVFRDGYELVLRVFRFAGTLSKAHKYSIGEMLRTESLRILQSIVAANSEYVWEKRIAFLAEAYKQAAFERQEELTQISAIKAEIAQLEKQKESANEVGSEEIMANIVAQETALETLEAEAEDELIREYEACRQDLLFKWLISGEVKVTSGEVTRVNTETKDSE